MHFPQYGHYFMFLLALNFGISVMDFYILKLFFSNEGHFIEEHQTGINILNKVPYQSFHSIIVSSLKHI